MSWSIKAIGTKAAIKAKIDASPYFPDAMKAAAKDVIDSNTALPDRLIAFESHGHVGNGCGSVGNFKVETIEFVGKTPREEELEELVRSACAIAERKGEGTAWERFSASAALLGLNGITARTYRVLPDDPAAVS